MKKKLNLKKLKRQLKDNAENGQKIALFKQEKKVKNDSQRNKIGRKKNKFKENAQNIYPINRLQYVKLRDNSTQIITRKENSCRGKAKVAIFIPSGVAHIIFS